MTAWTPAMLATLRTLWPDRDIPADAIAGRLGVSPAAACAMASRLGLARRTRQGGSAGRVRRMPGGFPALAGTDAAPEPAAPALRLLDPLPPCGCRWPTWPDWTRAPHPPRFCDAPTVPGSAYCDVHRDLSRRAPGGPWRRLPPPTLLARLLEAA